MLESTLNETAGQAAIIVHAEPDRFAGGAQVLKDHPDTDVFILDDGFQHRRLARDFDLVLISATEPWGFGHVHPRGLLRESPRGLARASAVIITHAAEATAAILDQIEKRIRLYTFAPIFHASHVQTALRSAAATDNTLHPIAELAGKPLYAFCGLGHPEGFFRNIAENGARLVGQRSFPDHYAYRPEDLRALDAAAVATGAEVLLTSEKDWSRLAGFLEAQQTKIPIRRVQLAMRFDEGDEDQLLSLVLLRCRPQTVKSPSIAVI